MLTSWGGTAAMHWWSRGVVGVSRLSDPGRRQPSHLHRQLRQNDLVPLACGRGLGQEPSGEGRGRHGTLWNSVLSWPTLGGATHVVGFRSKGV